MPVLKTGVLMQIWGRKTPCRSSRTNSMRLMSAVLLSALLTGCGLVNVPISVPINKTPKIMGSVTETGRVTMGSPYLYLEDPQIDWGEAREQAAAHCAKMGYAGGAEPVGATRKVCDGKVGSDCPRWAILGDYQCLK